MARPAPHIAGAQNGIQGASHEVQEKAQRLVDEHRVIPIRGAKTAMVVGDNGHYLVTAAAAGVSCSCPAKGLCSHSLAAMAWWGEHG